MMTDATRLRRATYSGSAAASLGRFKTRVAALLILAAVFLASAAAKHSLTDMVRGWVAQTAKCAHLAQTNGSLFLQSPSDLQFHI